MVPSPSAATANPSTATTANNVIRFSIWDLAGQTVFYDLLHILLTRYAVYVVCFDMQDMVGAGSTTSQADCIAYIKFWLSSIHLHAAGARLGVLVNTLHSSVAELHWV
jgi:GTPase SAR1 family protein